MYFTLYRIFCFVLFSCTSTVQVLGGSKQEMKMEMKSGEWCLHMINLASKTYQPAAGMEHLDDGMTGTGADIQN